jgi:hypothetical protein
MKSTYIFLFIIFCVGSISIKIFRDKYKFLGDKSFLYKIIILSILITLVMANRM